MSKRFINPAKYVVPFNINGMEGRMLRIEGHNRHNRKEILFIYDLESNLERWWGLAVALRYYANVNMIDLPGLGGMDSFFKIGKKPTLDNMADYLASYIKLKYKRKRLSIVGVGFGFTVVNRMLQRNPEIVSKVNILVCINGYAHKDDFKLNSFERGVVKTYSFLGWLRPFADLAWLLLYNELAIKLRHPSNKITAMRGGPSKEFIQRFRIDLLRCGDLRTRMYTNLELLKLDNCQKRIDKTLWHITTSNSDQNVNLRLVEQHFRVAFSEYNQLPAKVGRRMPLVFNDEKLARKYLPAKLRRLLKAHA